MKSWSAITSLSQGIFMLTILVLTSGLTAVEPSDKLAPPVTASESPDNYASLVEKNWNHLPCKPRTVWLRPPSGTILILEPGTDAWRSLHGLHDLQDVHLVGDVVEVRGWLHLPQAKVVIHARELRFVDKQDQRPSAICTTPLTPPPPSRDARLLRWEQRLARLQKEDDKPESWTEAVLAAPGGKFGASAGDIVVKAKSITFTVGEVARLDTTGGTGQGAFPGLDGKKGDDVPAVSIASLAQGMQSFLAQMPESMFHGPSSNALAPKQHVYRGGTHIRTEEIGTFVHIRPNWWTHKSEVGTRGWRDGRPAVAAGRPGSGGEGGKISLIGSDLLVPHALTRGPSGEMGSPHIGGAAGTPAKALSAVIASGSGVGSSEYLPYLILMDGRRHALKDKHYLWETLPAPSVGAKAEPQKPYPAKGGSGSFTVSPDGTWMDEDLVRLVYREARHQFQNDRPEAVRELLRPYVEASSTLPEPGEGLASCLAKMNSMWAHLSMGLDLYGHDRNWVPALQFSKLGVMHDALVQDLADPLWASIMLNAAAMDATRQREFCEHLLEKSSLDLGEISYQLDLLLTDSLSRTKELGNLESQWRQDQTILANLNASLTFHAAELARQAMEREKERGVRRAVFTGLSSIPFVGPVFAVGGAAIDAVDQDADTPEEIIQSAKDNEALLRRAYEGTKELLEWEKAARQKKKGKEDAPPAAKSDPTRTVVVDTHQEGPAGSQTTRIIIQDGKAPAPTPPVGAADTKGKKDDKVDWDRAGRVLQRFGDAAKNVAEELRRSLPTQAQYDERMAAERSRLGMLMQVPAIENRVLARTTAMLGQQEALRSLFEQTAALIDEAAKCAQQRELAGRLLSSAPAWERARDFRWLAEEMREDIMDRLGASEYLLRRAYRYTFLRDYPAPYDERKNLTLVLDALRSASAKPSPEEVKAALRAFFRETVNDYRDTMKDHFTKRGGFWGDGLKEIELSPSHLNQISALGTAIISPEELGLGHETNARLVRVTVEAVNLEPEAAKRSFRIGAFAMSPGTITARDGTKHSFVMGSEDGLHLGNCIVSPAKQGVGHTTNYLPNARAHMDGELKGLFADVGGPALMLAPASTPIRVTIRPDDQGNLPSVRSLRLKVEYLIHGN